MAIQCIILAMLLTTEYSNGFQHRLSLLSPNGIRIEIDDVPGTTLAAVHYSINQPLSGNSAGRWNFDIRTPTGEHKVLEDGTEGKWIHENRLPTVNVGDTVNYWLYLIINGLGQHALDLSWVATSSISTNSTATKTATTTTATRRPATTSTRPTTVRSRTLSTTEATDQIWRDRRLRMVLNETFNTQLNTDEWKHELTLSGGGNWEFQAYTNLPENSFTKNGALFLKPTFTAEKYGESFLTIGTWNVAEMYGRCTSSRDYGCQREGRFGLLNPILSARLNSRKSIRYGKVEVVAKMPRGDWIWPAIWMLPVSEAYGDWPMSGEIDMAEFRGNRKYGNLGIEWMDTTLHWGTPGDFGDGFHKYTLLWDESTMQFYLDDVMVAEYTTPAQGFFRWENLPEAISGSHSSNAPFDREFYLILNVAIGGTNGYFPDNVDNFRYAKPWTNNGDNARRKFWKARDSWLPTWQGDDAAMQVDSVKMWQLE